MSRVVIEQDLGVEHQFLGFASKMHHGDAVAERVMEPPHRLGFGRDVQLERDETLIETVARRTIRRWSPKRTGTL